MRRNNSNPRNHSIYRNGRLYDQLDPRTHAVMQIARSLSGDMPGDTFTVRNGDGVDYFVIKTSAESRANGNQH